MVKEVKESNTRRVDEKVKSMIRIDGVKIISSSHSTQTFYRYRAYYFPPLSLGARYELSLFQYFIQQQLSITHQFSSSSIGDGRFDSNTKKSFKCAAAAAKDTEDVAFRSEEAK